MTIFIVVPAMTSLPSPSGVTGKVDMKGLGQYLIRLILSMLEHQYSDEVQVI